MACGGGGGGSSDPAAIITETGTTPLSQTDDASLTGTYRITFFDFNYSTGEYFSSNELDYFSGLLTMDAAADSMIYELEWRDSQYGDFYDYDESSISGADPDATWDSAYYEIIDDYTIVFSYENFCSGGYCADVTMRIQKMTDTVQPLIDQRTMLKAANDPANDQSIVAEAVRSLSF